MSSERIEQEPQVARLILWAHVLKALYARFGVNEPVSIQKVCVDPKVQWSRVMNVWHNAGARSMLYTIAATARWMRSLTRRQTSQ